MAANITTFDGDDDDDWVVIQCTDPTNSPPSNDSDEIFISTAQISSWDLPSILAFSTVKITINRSRLIQQSSYFQSLLSGNFSESSMCCISIQWSLETFLHILRFMHGCHVELTMHSFLPLCHAALYFGLERLAFECKKWFSDVVMNVGLSSAVNLDEIILFWEFGLDNAINWIPELCIGYVARNFMWALSSGTFVDLPYRFLVSCVKHPNLTVDSERYLCEALLAWLRANMELFEQKSTEDWQSDKSKEMSIIIHDWASILEEVHISLLPLWFITGNSRCQFFSVVAKEGFVAITKMLKKSSKDANYLIDDSGQKNMRIRLTQYSKRINLSGCPQITFSVLLLSMLHQSASMGSLPLEDIGRRSIDLQCPKWISSLPIISFKAMVEVDISKCSMLNLGAAMECFRRSFPYLRILHMTYFLDFETKNLCKLIENYSSISEIDLTVDVSPLLPSNISVLYTESLGRPSLKKYNDIPPCPGRRPTVSNITKLTLEGRSDFTDLELHLIADFCISLCYLNIKGCSLVTDIGIANLLMNCRKLHSIIATDTAFGRNSASALCSRVLNNEHPLMDIDTRHIEMSGYLQELHMGGCRGVSQTSLAHILSCGHMLKNLCLRDTSLVDQVLYRFPGSSLETLDVSNTMISRDALLHMLIKNPGLRNLDARGCKNLCPNQCKHEEESSSSCDQVFGVLGQKYKLEELLIGWGFSFFTIHSLGSALRSLKSINVGLGGSLGPEGMILLYTLCPLLESVTILFQVICETVIVNLLETLKNLKALSVCYCMGDLSSLSLKHSVPNLRSLKLERVTPRMTNDDLALLTRNCANIIELSLAGCTHLGVESQQIISSGWPGLIALHLEDCGAVTEKGTSSIFDCQALEDLLLRHNGCGIQKSFILDAASSLPMLRSISLDWCDASEGDFNLPNFADKYSLSCVKISRCKLRKCTLDFQYVKAQKRPVHKETLVLEWNSTSLRRTVVEDRIK